jgi:hypothetical protein
MTEMISGVGKNSRRTDKNISNRTTQGAKQIKSSKYGESKMLEDIQKQGAMQGASAKVPRLSMGQSAPGAREDSGLPRVTPLFSDTQRLDEPPEAGMSFGDGPGSEMITPFPDQTRKISDILQQIAQYDTSGEVNALLEEALLKGF